MGTNPGTLRERLTLQSSTRAPDGGGGWTNTWADVAPEVTVAARVRPLLRNERLQAMQADAQASHLVEIRYRTDVTPKQRWRWGSGRYLRIVSAPINPDEHREMLEMFAVEDRG